MLSGIVNLSWIRRLVRYVRYVTVVEQTILSLTSRQSVSIYLFIHIALRQFEHRKAVDASVTLHEITSLNYSLVVGGKVQFYTVSSKSFFILNLFLWFEEIADPEQNGAISSCQLKQFRCTISANMILTLLLYVIVDATKKS